MLHGVGKNGKSTLVEPFQDLLGDYSGVAHPNVIMQQKYSDATAQYALAALKGRRFVSVSETKRGVELEAATVKQITGNDTISARAPYGQPFAYRPQFKLWMSTNHKPEIPDGSEAIWDRLRLIPFTQRFDGKRADADLPEKLREELSGVLAWAVTGCVTWAAEGLGTSRAVEAATAAYRAETDVLERFFEDECQFGPKLKVGKTALWEAWEHWCDGEGEDAGAKNTFGSLVKERGIVKGFVDDRDTDGSRIWRGISLYPPPDGESVKSQKPCKPGGVVTEFDRLSSNSENYPQESLSRGVSRKTQKSVKSVKSGDIPPVRDYTVYYHDANEGE